jgi:hypothetical protein
MLEKLARHKQSSLLQKFVNYVLKSFVTLDPEQAQWSNKCFEGKNHAFKSFYAIFLQIVFRFVNSAVVPL